MSRRVVTGGTERCERCRYLPRWCTCAGLRTARSRVQVDILMHRHEMWRPTSTGALIGRVMPESRGHVFSHDLPLDREAIVRPGHALWILHPSGDPPPSLPPSEPLQVLLLDGSWREASRMRKRVETWGRWIGLPPRQESRYRLRSQHAPGMFSTVEALIQLLEGLGEVEAAGTLRIQFELHVYAGLRSRGSIQEAERFLADSPLAAMLPEVLLEMQRRRSRQETRLPAHGVESEVGGRPLPQSG